MGNKEKNKGKEQRRKEEVGRARKTQNLLLPPLRACALMQEGKGERCPNIGMRGEEEREGRRQKVEEVTQP